MYKLGLRSTRKQKPMAKKAKGKARGLNREPDENIKAVVDSREELIKRQIEEANIEVTETCQGCQYFSEAPKLGDVLDNRHKCRMHYIFIRKDSTACKEYNTAR